MVTNAPEVNKCTWPPESSLSPTLLSFFVHHTTTMSRQLVACMLNVSEGRNLALVERIAQSALRAVNPPAKKTAVEGWKINASVLNIFQDFDYNRSVITIVAGQDNIGASVEAACRTAYDLIDLSRQEGVHPRLGAVDLVPLHPISENMSLHTLGAVAKVTPTTAAAAATSLTQPCTGRTIDTHWLCSHFTMSSFYPPCEVSATHHCE
ncbi:Glutamate formimidoyltransferase [Portunus trituberculatus]|uniref:Glutamate formimidoyltransferase n=1 Tax=Portunus trituberculatus TaxID=210409 RepID=A0A5B7E5N8_PORTR|nr:Glutamate formimidoyltransferase [Portunus trituberculatus]